MGAFRRRIASMNHLPASSEQSNATMKLTRPKNFSLMYAAGMSRALYLLIPLCVACIHAEDKKKKEEEKKPQPPRVMVALPLGLVPGMTNMITLRGQSLTNVTECRFVEPNPPFEATIKSKSKADVPRGLDAAKVGDTEIELHLVIPSDASPGSNALVFVNPEGESPPFWLLTLAADSLIEEQEPNPGFAQSQQIPLKQIVRGSIKQANDVDVFRFTGKAGQKIRIEVQGARWGTPLDSIVTLYRAGARLVSVNDDSEAKTDSVLRTQLPADGEYFISLQDAHDRGGPLHGYLLSVNTEE
jgi:hypothetical protein